VSPAVACVVAEAAALGGPGPRWGAVGRGGRGATGAFLRLVSTGPTTSLGAAADGPAPWWRAAGGAAVPPYRSCGLPAGEPGGGCGNGRGNGRPWAGPGRQW